MNDKNNKKQMTKFQDLISSEEYKNSNGELVYPVGMFANGQIFVDDLRKQYHLMINHKDDCNGMNYVKHVLCSFLSRYDMFNLRLIITGTEDVASNYSEFCGCDRLLYGHPNEDVISVLKDCFDEMQDRYNLLKENGLKNIEEYNKFHHLLPYWVVAVDVDLKKINDKKTFYGLLKVITQKGKFAGILIILCFKNKIATSSLKYSIYSRVDIREKLNKKGYISFKYYSESIIAEKYLTLDRRFLSLYAIAPTTEDIERYKKVSN